MANPSNDIIELENTGRDVLILPIVDLRGKDKVPHVLEYFVIGDARDRVEFVPGAREEHLQPNPVRTITQEQLARLGEPNLKLLAAYIKSGVIRVMRGDPTLILAAAV